MRVRGLVLFLVGLAAAREPCMCYDTQLAWQDKDLVLPTYARHVCLAPSCPPNLDPATKLYLPQDGSRIRIGDDLFVAKELGETIVYHENPTSGLRTMVARMVGQAGFFGSLITSSVTMPSSGLYMGGQPTRKQFGIWQATHVFSNTDEVMQPLGLQYYVYCPQNAALAGWLFTDVDNENVKESWVVMLPGLVVVGDVAYENIVRNKGASFIGQGPQVVGELDLRGARVRCVDVYPDGTRNILAWSKYTGTSTCAVFRYVDRQTDSVVLTDTCYDVTSAPYDVFLSAVATNLQPAVKRVKFPSLCPQIGGTALQLALYTDADCTTQLVGSPLNVNLGQCINNKVVFTCASKTVSA